MSSSQPQTPATGLKDSLTNPIISLNNVSFGYTPTQPIIQNFNWTVSQGETWSILGISGSGKTTLLYLIAGLRQIQEGKISLRDTIIDQPSHDVGLMLQTYGLLPWLTAERNVQLGLKIRGVPKAERYRIRAEWLERMQISHIAKRYPAQLSGGQRQRVALARVLALETDILLLDEPLSAVDELTRERLQKTLWEITKELQSTLLMVTHSVEEAALLTDNVLVFPDTTPVSHPQIIRSPFAGEAMPSREDMDFHRYCGVIRRALGL